MTFYGFTDSLSPMRKARVEKILSHSGKYTTVTYAGRLYSWPEYIRTIVGQGGDFIERNLPDGRIEYGVYVGGYANGKLEYKASDKRVYVQLNKTQYAFARYLRRNGFDADDVAEAYRQKEAEREAMKTQSERLAEQRAAEEAKAKRQAREDFQRRMEQAALEVIAEDGQFLEALQKIFSRQSCPISARSPFLLGAIRLLPDPHAKDFLREALYTGNKASRMAFELFTGRKLPASNRETRAFIEELSSVELIRPSISDTPCAEPAGEKFYVLRHDGQFYEAYGQRVPNRYGMDLFTHKERGQWHVTEGRSGTLLCGGLTNKKYILKQIEDFLDSMNAGAIEHAVAYSVEEHGLSPLYQSS